jgi:hypothetical protein
VVSFLQVLPSATLHAFAPPPQVTHAPTTPFALTGSPEQFIVKSKKSQHSSLGIFPPIFLSSFSSVPQLVTDHFIDPSFWISDSIVKQTTNKHRNISSQHDYSINQKVDGQIHPHYHHHHHIHEGLGVFPVPGSSRWSWSLHLFLGRSFGLYCSACFVVLFVSILWTDGQIKILNCKYTSIICGFVIHPVYVASNGWVMDE